MKVIGQNRSTREKPCPSAILSTTNPTWTNPGSNPGLRGGRSATDRLSLGTAGRHLYMPFDTVENGMPLTILRSDLLISS
jgi:hypothetical protein